MPDHETSEPVMAGSAEQEPPGVIEPVTCMLCGCLCDDIAVTLDGEAVVEVEHGCELCRGWLLRGRARPSGAGVARLNGIPASVEEGMARAAELLGGREGPDRPGLDHSTNETVQAALELADLIGATSSRAIRRRRCHERSPSSAGRVSATLGEVKNRADVVVFWGADPVETHPRHWARYSVEPEGRFVPGGRAGRTVIVVDRRTHGDGREGRLLPGRRAGDGV